MKASEIRELSDADLAQKLEDGRAELFNLRFQMATSSWITLRASLPSSMRLHGF